MDKNIQMMGKRIKTRVSDESTPAKKFKKASSQQYNDSYLHFGFTWTDFILPQPQSIVCGTKLANEAIEPKKLKRLLDNLH